MDDALRRQTLISNIAGNMVAAGQGRAPVGVADALMGARTNESNLNTQSLTNTLAQRQADRLDRRLGYDERVESNAQSRLDQTEMELQMVGRVLNSSATPEDALVKLRMLPRSKASVEAITQMFSRMNEDPNKMFTGGQNFTQERTNALTGAPETVGQGTSGKQTFNIGGANKFEDTMALNAANLINDWDTDGEAAFNRNMTNLEYAAEALGNSDDISGPFIGLMPDWALAFGSPESLSVRDAVHGVAMQDLKKILGGQFGEREGERLIEKSFNPKLEEGENKRRVLIMIEFGKQIAASKQARVDWAREHRTTAGYKSTLPTVADIDKALNAKPKEPKTEGKTFKVKPTSVPKGMKLQYNSQTGEYRFQKGGG